MAQQLSSEAHERIKSLFFFNQGLIFVKSLT